MKQNLLSHKLGLPLLLSLCLMGFARSSFAGAQVSYEWKDTNPYTGENDPGYYLRFVWDDPDAAYAEYYWWTEDDFASYVNECTPWDYPQFSF